MNFVNNWRMRAPARRLQLFVHDLSATGVVRNAIALANEAAASGYEVRLLTCNAEGMLRGQVGPNVAVVKLNEGRGRRRSRNLDMIRALFAYRRHSRDWAPDLMMSAGNHGHLLSTLAWLGLPGVTVLRFSNDLTHGSPSRLTRLWREARFRLMAWLANRLIYVSRAQGEHPLLAGQLDAGKALVIPNGVDLEFVRSEAAKNCPHSWLTDESIPVVLAVGRHVKQKNFHMLLSAFAQARARRPMRLMFLGDGKPVEIDRIKRLAAELGVERDVAFVPAVANPFPYMAAAAAFVLPSRWEGSANVLLEAMACGTPVVASRTAGDAEHVLASGEYGMLVDPLNEVEIANAMLRQIGPNAIQPGARANAFCRRLVLRRYLRLFDTLVEEHEPKTAAALTTPSVRT
jgi:glycosyltransferase involved in cell wall biosynthesis